MTNNRELLGFYKQLVKAIMRNDKRSKIIQRNNQITKQISLLTYERMKLVQQQTVDTFAKLKIVDARLASLKSEDPSKDKSINFVQGDMISFIREELSGQQAESISGKKLQHYQDVITFLNNQREYDELVERYNLGEFKNMSQDERVKRTANRVGLDVPF